MEMAAVIGVSKGGCPRRKHQWFELNTRIPIKSWAFQQPVFVCDWFLHRQGLFFLYQCYFSRHQVLDLGECVMKLKTLMAALAMTLLGQSLSAHDEDPAFEERVSQYLLAHPEIILQALEVLSAREAEANLAARIAQFPELFSVPAVLGMGSKEAPIRVVEFFDYKCVPCKAIHPKLKLFVEATPDVRIEMRQLPILSPGSERATRFALAVRHLAGEEAYTIAHELLWTHRGPYNTAVFAKMAQTLAMDLSEIEAAMRSDEVSEIIGTNRDIAIELEILGTPAFVTPTSLSFGQSDFDALTQSWINQ